MATAHPAPSPSAVSLESLATLWRWFARRQLAGIAAAVALALVASGCEATSETSVGPSPPKCGVSLASSTDALASSGGAGTVSVTTQPECAWSASANVTWISQISPAAGQGSGDVRFQVAANTSLTARQGAIDVNGVSLPIAQQAAQAPPPPPPPSCVFQLDRTSTSVAAAGDRQNVVVRTSSECSWTAASHASWIVITGGAAGIGNQNVTFEVAPNTGAARIGTLTVAGQVFTVSQAAGSAPSPSCTYSIQPSSQAVAAAGGPVTSSVTAGVGCTWTAVSTVQWITITAGATGSGNGAVGFTVAANTAAARVGTLTIAGQTFTVNQAAGVVPCTYLIQPTSQSIGAAGGPGTSSVTAGAGCPWTAASSAQWITITAGASGNGNGSVGFTIAANVDAARTGTLTIAGQTFTVTQASGCTYSLSATDAAFTIVGGLGGPVNVSTSAGCPWSAASNVPWITIVTGASGAGNGSVTYLVAVSLGARTGTLTIAGQTFTVNQGN